MADSIDQAIPLSPDRGDVQVRRIVNIPIYDGILANFVSFKGLGHDGEHIAIGLGPWRQQSVPLVRLHSECLTGDIFGSKKCDCGPQLKEAVRRVAQDGGLVLYLRQEGRGIGLYNKLDAYYLQSLGYDTFEANNMLNFDDDLRDFSCAAKMLKALGIQRIRLLTNNPDKKRQLEEHGIEIVKVVTTGIYICQANQRYLRAKVEKAQHQIPFTGDRHD